MTVSTTTNRWAYTGNAVTTAFAYTNLVFAGTDLKVYLDGVLQVSGYTVSGAGEPTGGSVTFTAAPGSGVAVLIVSDIPRTQPLDLGEFDAFPSESVEDALDRQIRINQQLATRLERTVRLSDALDAADTLDALPEAEDRANGVLGFDADGQPMIASGVTETAISAAMEPVVQAASLAAARTAMDVQQLNASLTALAAAAAADAGKVPVVSTAGVLALAGPLTGARRNLLDNGGMTVAQRGSSASGVGASATQTVIDRWMLQSFSSASARWTVSRENAGGVKGRSGWQKLLCTTADASPGASEGQAIYQQVEAQNLYSRARDATGLVASVVSFDAIFHKDAASSITFPLTACLFAYSVDGTVRYYLGTFTITAADTWQRVTVSLPADATVSFDNDNGIGFQLGFGLYGGSSRVGTANAWTTNVGTVCATAATANMADAANNYFGFTNFQWEVGTAATPFEHTDPADELVRCARWFERLAFASASGENIAGGGTLGAALGWAVLPYGPKRTAAAVSFTAAGTFQWIDGGNNTRAVSAIAASEVGARSCGLNVTIAGATTGGGYLRRDGTDDCSIDISAE